MGRQESRRAGATAREGGGQGRRGSQQEAEREPEGAVGVGVGVAVGVGVGVGVGVRIGSRVGAEAEDAVEETRGRDAAVGPPTLREQVLVERTGGRAARDVAGRAVVRPRATLVGGGGRAPTPRRRPRGPTPRPPSARP